MSYSKEILFFYDFNFKKYLNFYSKYFNNVCCDFIGSYACGDIIFLQIFFSIFNTFVIDCSYKIYGCGSAISSICISSYYILNKIYYKLLNLKNYYISEKLKLPSLKFHCSVLVEEILILNLINYKNNYIVFFF